jgi:hypothetical protein
MKTIATRIAAVAVLALLGTLPALAHHATGAVYDASKSFSVTGVVEKIEWINPHIYIYLNVTDEKGQVTRWALECLPPGMMTRAGVKRDAVLVGQKLVASGFRAKDANVARVWPLKLTFDDGRVLQLMDENEAHDKFGG